MNDLEELKIRIDRIKRLLDDPHPGLMTWCQSLSDNLDWIVKY